MNQKYEELQKKYLLPSYDELSSDFDIDTIGKDDNIIRETIKKMYEKIEFYSKVVESLIQPDSNYASMKEASVLSFHEQELVRKLFIELMYLERQFVLQSLEYHEKESAEFINKIYLQWRKLKPELKLILTKIIDTWKKQNQTQLDKGYFG